MEIQFASDIHLDIRSFFQLEKRGDILILAGDIGQPFKANYRKFLSSLDGFKTILLVSGNHEYYSSSHTKPQIDEEIAAVCSKLPNVVPLQMSSFSLDNGTLVLGTTLWSRVDNEYEVESIMSDYVRIRVKQGERKVKIKTSDTLAWHEQELDWLLMQLEAHKEQPVIIVTHHAPSMQSCQIYHQHNPKKDIPNVDDAYATSLEWICEKYPNITHWIHGHVHQPLAYKIGNCQVLCNPIGYPGQIASGQLPDTFTL